MLESVRCNVEVRLLTRLLNDGSLVEGMEGVESNDCYYTGTISTLTYELDNEPERVANLQATAGENANENQLRS
jgi:hypothetical protein